MNYLTHITLHTGHSRRSPRNEVSATTIATLAPRIVEAENGTSVALVDGWTLRRLDAGADGRHTRQWALAPDNEQTVIVLALAMKSRPGATLWRRLHTVLDDVATNADNLPPAPWLAAYWDIARAGGHAGDMHWLADAERTLAWAWIESCYGR